MSMWTRIVNLFRGSRLNRELDEEFDSHIEEAIQQGRDPAEARKAFGSALRLREESREIRLFSWAESLRADIVFGARQLRKNKVTSAAAILSLALATGACTSAFRLIDALLLRPLPVSEPDRLYALFRQGIGPDGKPRVSDSYEFPLFQQMRAAVKGRAELLAISYSDRTDLTYGPDEEMEKVHRQFVSGWTFSALGIQPALGRVFSESDDLKPGAHPYAVLSHDYWTSRFGQNPNVIGKTFRMGNEVYEIVGVAGERFTGTEPGIVTGIFFPSMMHPGAIHADWSWLRIFVRPAPGAPVEPLRDQLRMLFRESQLERAKTFKDRPQIWLSRFLGETLLLEHAASGLSEFQKNNRGSLAALAVLVGLVLLIACGNVANLLTAQAAARAREMALRVSIGAGRWRLVQLVLVESAWLAVLASLLGGAFAWWSAPFVVSRINPPGDPARLLLPADWRVFGFALALTLAVTFLFGSLPALRASAVKPVNALRGGEDAHTRRGMMHVLIAAQVAFCFLVLFVAGLFVATFNRLSNQPTGFSAERVLTLDANRQPPLPASSWDQVAEHLRTVPGVEAVALAGWPLLSGNGLYGFISVNGAPPAEDQAYFLSVSPGWAEVMKIPFLEGRDFVESDTSPGVAIVNEAFAKRYLGANPVGKTFEKGESEGKRIRFQVVGVLRDARYRNMREPITPTAYIPFHAVDAAGAPQPVRNAAFILRTASADPLALSATLRREAPRARSEFRISNVRTQQELNASHTFRERLLAMLALFFAVIALLLAAVGLYGVLDYSVLQRRREIGIRIAVGAPAADIARRVTVEVFSMVLSGAVAGLLLGRASVHYFAALLYQVNATDPAMLALPSAAILIAACAAALPAITRALRIDPVTMLRSE